jgi:hypothetical protein
MRGALPPLPQYVFMAWCLIKHRDNLLPFTCLEPGYLSGMALGYGLDDREFETWQGLAIFVFTTAFTPVLGPTQLPVEWVPGAHSLWVKQPGREADHSPPYLHLVPRWGMRGAIPPLPQYAVMAWCSVKAQGQLYFYKLRILDNLAD